MAMPPVRTTPTSLAESATLHFAGSGSAIGELFGINVFV
jgi:hypothetical protein